MEFLGTGGGFISVFLWRLCSPFNCEMVVDLSDGAIWACCVL